jgi:hypothetical protein
MVPRLSSVHMRRARATSNRAGGILPRATHGRISLMNAYDAPAYIIYIIPMGFARTLLRARILNSLWRLGIPSDLPGTPFANRAVSLAGNLRRGHAADRRPPRDPTFAPDGSQASVSLAMNGYPSDLQDAAVQNVLQQAEALLAEWGVGGQW